MTMGITITTTDNTTITTMGTTTGTTITTTRMKGLPWLPISG